MKQLTFTVAMKNRWKERESTLFQSIYFQNKNRLMSLQKDLKTELEIIGSEEWCVFETLGIPAIKARVDSGAKTSSIQATNTKVYLKGGHEWVKFEVNPLQENRSISIACEAPLVDRRMVKSSSGISEERLVVKTVLSLGKHTFEIELTLIFG